MADELAPRVADWQARIREAGQRGQSLGIRGGGSKAFYGRAMDVPDDWLETREYTGVISYEPSELVVRVRAGTPLVELEAVLAEQKQGLAFEPPHFGDATVGGCVAAGLSGPRRLAAGSVRDFVLGVAVLDGRGERMSFGGQVMKNVAGYDVARLMTGSLGTLGLLLEVSLKVLPLPRYECSVQFEVSEAEALRRCNEWGGQPVPVSASVWQEGVLTLRLSGSEPAVRSAKARLGGQGLASSEASAFWQDVREHRAASLSASDAPLWRLSVPAVTPPVVVDGAEASAVIEWGGALRWVRSAAAPAVIQAQAQALGGHATLFRGGDRSGDVFQPLAPTLHALQQRVKQAFDPLGVFNRGRMYAGI